METFTFLFSEIEYTDQVFFLKAKYPGVRMPYIEKIAEIYGELDPEINMYLTDDKVFYKVPPNLDEQLKPLISKWL